MTPAGPVDPHTSGSPLLQRPADTLTGSRVTLRRPSPSRDADVLFAATHGSAEAEATWEYMGYGPWPDAASMAAWIRRCRRSDDPKWYTVSADGGTPIGMTAFLAHHREDRRVEVGHIWYVPTARRTTANTEVVLLMGGHAFGSLACRRLEWKCDARNAASRTSAERLGFTFEGIFRQHMIVKGANRDTAWYSVIDREWPRIERALRAWLYETPRDDRGKPVRRLEEVRATVGGSRLGEG
jgi:RimJ/RimL family protein N-acetyltransferase